MLRKMNTKIHFSYMRNCIDSIYTKLLKRYDAFKPRLVSLEVNMSAASSYTLAAK